MKKIKMSQTFTYAPRRNVHIMYEAGVTYDRVPEAAAKAILDAKAGVVVSSKKREASDE